MHQSITFYLFLKSSHLELKSIPVPSRLKDGWRESNPSIINFYSFTGLEQLALQALADYFKGVREESKRKVIKHFQKKGN